jgi:hypothetical protein
VKNHLKGAYVKKHLITATICDANRGQKAQTHTICSANRIPYSH